MTIMSDQITAVILAGGANTRFGGKDKAFVMIDGMSMVELVTGRLEKVFKKILVITNSPEKYAGYRNIDVFTDIIRNAGPLGGIHSAMKYSTTPFIFVVSCDMPHIDAGIIRGQKEFFGGLHNSVDALVPRVNSNIEPLHAIYRAGLAGMLEEFLSAGTGYSIRAFLKIVKVAYMDLPATAHVTKAFSNINKLSDLPGYLS